MNIQLSNFGEHRDVRYQQVNDTVNIAPNIHEFTEIIIASEGEFSVTVDGRTEKVLPGEAALIFPFQVHSFSSNMKNDASIFVFSSTMIPDFFNNNAGKVGERCAFKLSPITLHVFKEKIKNSTKLPLYETTGFLYFIINDFAEQVKMKNIDKVNNIARRVISHVNENLAKKISLTDMAKDLGYSPKYLSNCINKLFSMGVSTLVSCLRTERAKYLLRTTNKSGIEICFECGFGSERSFHRQFKEITGISPRSYRIRFHNVSINSGFVTRYDKDVKNV